MKQSNPKKIIIIKANLGKINLKVIDGKNHKIIITKLRAESESTKKNEIQQNSQVQPQVQIVKKLILHIL